MRRDAVFFQIKAATRDLISASGGVARAGEICGAATGTLSRWQSAGHDDVIPILAAFALEAECGLRPVSDAIAAIAKGAAPAGPSAAAVMGAAVTASNAAGLALREAAEAASDHVVTPMEAERIDRKAAEAEAGIREVRQLCAHLRVV